VIGHAERAARLEHVEERLEHQRRGVVHGPVVHVAEREHDVGGRRCSERRRRAVELDRLRLAVALGIAFELLLQRALVLRRFALGLLRLRHRRDVGAIALHQRRQHFRVPAAARGDLDQGLAGLDAEERQRLLRMAILVARLVRGGTPVAGKDRVELGAEQRIGAGRRRRLRRLVDRCRRRLRRGRDRCSGFLRAARGEREGEGNQGGLERVHGDSSIDRKQGARG